MSVELRTLHFLIYNKVRKTYLFKQGGKLSVPSMQYSPMFDPWDNCATGRYFYEHMSGSLVTEDLEYVKMIQDEKYKDLLGIINDAQIVESSDDHKVYHLDFDDAHTIPNTVELQEYQLSDLKENFDPISSALVQKYLIQRIQHQVQPTYICHLNPSPNAMSGCRNVEEALHRGYQQEQNEVWVTYKVTQGEFPRIDELHMFSAIVINGSASAAYDKTLPWLEPLKHLLRQCRAMNKRMYGVCFGHQIMAETFGGKVEPIGLEHNIRLRKPVNETIQIDDLFHENITVYYSHGDQVIRIPDGTHQVFSSDHCNITSYQGDNILGVQFHPEYNKIILKELVMADHKMKEKEHFLKKIDHSLTVGNEDSMILRKIIKKFLKEGQPIQLVKQPISPSTSIESVA